MRVLDNGQNNKATITGLWLPTEIENTLISGKNIYIAIFLVEPNRAFEGKTAKPKQK